MKKLFLLFILLISCTTDNDIPVTGSETPDPEVIDTPLTYTANVVSYDEDLMQNGYVLAVNGGNMSSFLMDKGGNKVKEWDFAHKLGNDLELLPTGQLIGMFKTNTPSIFFGGYGGIIKILNVDGSVDWEYNYANDTVMAHHDVEQLPNGNILFIAWKEVDNTTAQNNGFEIDQVIYTEVLLEINPNTNQIVWEWDSMDHLVQDYNAAALNFGDINANPQLIDINYNSDIANGDIMHANGIDYDASKDIIYLSVNNYSEVWVIDHSTTTNEAASHTGGNYNKGGDLLYRFGNPETYGNTAGIRLFYNNHHPNIIESNKPGADNFIIYVNNSSGPSVGQSIVYELDIPDVFNLTSNANNEPEVVWSFTDSEMYFQRVSGAQRLNNGNTLICEGDYGFWEVTPTGEVAWKYSKLDGLGFWRGYSYLPNDSAIINLDL